VKLGRGFMSADKLEEIDIGDGDKPRLWRPRFLITVINANDRISRSIGQP
jgi:hypothetical protein